MVLCRFLNKQRVFFVTAIILIATAAFAAVGGSISGTVKDTTGGVIPGATLTLTNTALGTQFKTTADTQGLYSFPSLPVGRYELTIDAAGFTSQKKQGLSSTRTARCKSPPRWKYREYRT